MRIYHAARHAVHNTHTPRRHHHDARRTQSNTHRSQALLNMPNLLDIPPELRLQIYHHTLIKPHPYDIGQVAHFILDKRSICAQLAQPGLTRTNRVLRRETLPIFYGENAFDAPSFPHEGVRDWLLAMGPANRCLLKRFSTFQDRWNSQSPGEVERALQSMVVGLSLIHI